MYDKFIVEGLKINKELIEENRHIIDSVYVSNPDHLSILNNTRIQELLCQVTPIQMRQISQMTTPPGILSVCSMPPESILPNDLRGKKVLYLDAIRDPGNLGTILRIADWFGLDYVICSPDCVDIFNHKVIQSSMGSALRVNVASMNIEDLLSRNEPMYVCDAHGKSIYDIRPPSDGIIILGNESLGVSDHLSQQATEIFAIPGHAGKGAESLNVASAAAIIAAWWWQA